MLVTMSTSQKSMWNSTLDLDEKDILELLQQGEYWNITVNKAADDMTNANSEQPLPTKTNNIIHIGDLLEEELTPLEEEEEVHDAKNGVKSRAIRQCYTQTLMLTVNTSHLFTSNAKISIQRFHILPENNDAIRPVVYFQDATSSKLFSSLELTPASSVLFKMKVVFPPEFKGSFNRLVVLDFEVKEILTKFASRSTTLRFGLLILGSVIMKAAEHSLKENQLESSSKRNLQLSAEAAPFIPLGDMMYFQSQVVIHVIYCMSFLHFH